MPGNRVRRPNTYNRINKNHINQLITNYLPVCYLLKIQHLALVDVTTKFRDSMMLNFLNNLLNILMIFK